MIKTETTKKVASNTIFQFIGKAITMSITVLATIIITKIYGREDYGAFSLMQSWPALMFIIVDFGLNAIATRELSKDYTKADKYLANIFALRLLLSLVFIVGMWVALMFFPYDQGLKLGIRLSLFLILTQALFTSTNIIFQTKLRYDLATIALISGYTFILAAIIVISYLKLSVIWISFSYVIGGLITFIFALFLLRKLGTRIRLEWDSKLIKYLLVQTLPLGIMFVFSQMNFKEDEILLSVLSLPSKYGLNNTESVAVYALPYKVFEVALVVPTFFMNSVYPIMVRHLMESEQRMKDTFRKTLMVLFSSGIFVGIVGIIFAPLIIHILGGVEFTQSILVLRILLGGLVFFYMTQPLSWLIVTLEQQKILPYIYLVAAIFNFTINLVFIPKYSFYGAAVMTHMSEFLVLILLFIVSQKAWRNYYAKNS